MPSLRYRSGRVASALLLIAGAGAACAGPLVAEPDARTGVATAEGPARCELQVSQQGGLVALTALVETRERASGSYELRITGRGTNIRQGGPFSAAPGHPATLGSVTLSGDGAAYDADLEITANGRTTACTRRIGGRV